MKKWLFLIIGIACFLSCKEKQDKTISEQSLVNNLIAPKACITYEQEMIVPAEYFFFKSIDFRAFVSKLQQKSVQKTITAHIPFSDIACNDEDIQRKFKDEFSIDEFQTMLFDEEWILDTAQFIMKKKVDSYSLVRNYIRHNPYTNTDIPTKSIVAKYDFSKSGFSSPNDKNFKLLQSDVAYEVPLINETNPEFLENIQVKQVVKTIVEKATCGNTPAYSFSFRDSLISKDLKEVTESLGKETICYEEEESETAETDSVCIDKEIDLREIIGLAFIEDWYVNDSTMEILKEVKAIAPVRAYYHTTEDTQSELVKSIPFVMYLKNHDKGK